MEGIEDGLPADRLPRAGRPRRPRQLPAARPRAAFAELTGAELVELTGAGHIAMVAPPGPGQPADPDVRRPLGPPAAAAGLGPRAAPAPGTAALLADRPRPCLARRRGGARAAPPVPGLEVHWLAQPPVTHCWRPAGEQVHPGERRARSRGRARRRRGGRSRAARLPRAAPARRDLLRELHGLPRRGQPGAVRRVDRRRGVGGRPLPAREPGAQDRAVRVDDRLRRHAADARGRRARGVPGRRPQRRDGRARRPPPGAARPLDLHRRPGGHRGRAARAGAADDPRLDRGALPTSPATSLPSR